MQRHVMLHQLWELFIVFDWCWMSQRIDLMRIDENAAITYLVMSFIIKTLCTGDDICTIELGQHSFRS